MTDRLEKIRSYVAKIPFVQQVYHLEQKESLIEGKVEIAFEGLDVSLDFDIQIAPFYPMKSYDSEGIRFFNRDLIHLNHVMEGGNICIHTSHSLNLEEKLSIDFDSLRNWIVKYYINRDIDSNYEHIIVNEGLVGEQYIAYLFTDCEGDFIKGEYGKVLLSPLKTGRYKQKGIISFIVQNFQSTQGEEKKCQWSNIYKDLPHDQLGFYCFVESPPASYGRFALKDWKDLEELLPRDFLNFLHDFEKKRLNENRGRTLPLFLGYRTVGTEVHWQVAILTVGEFPLAGVPERVGGQKTGKWHSELVEKNIIWALSRNTSYKYFFGRGAFHRELTEKQILIIGVGALGSMVAKTLVRCGCRHVDFFDYDVKEPENVCRSEYMFSNGVTDKSHELRGILSDISPFVNIRHVNERYFDRSIKTFYDDDGSKNQIIADLNNYDVIIDCSTDNDLMYVLSTLEFKGKLINMSITNHAKSLVCAFSPNVYRFVSNQFANVLQNDTADLYEPTGCWSPTFKASYNDIDVLVQLALKHINASLKNGSPLNNFVVQEIDGTLKVTGF